jgi:hypothetical protein
LAVLEFILYYLQHLLCILLLLGMIEVEWQIKTMALNMDPNLEVETRSGQVFKWDLHQRA